MARERVAARRAPSPETLRRCEIKMEYLKMTEGLVKSQKPLVDPELVEKCRSDLLEKHGKPKVVFRPRTVVDSSAATCATKSEAGIYKRLAYSRDIIFAIINPATGIADEVLGAAVLKRYREGLGKETVVTTSGVADDEEVGAFGLKRNYKDVGVSNETLVASDEVREASVLKRHRQNPSESV